MNIKKIARELSLLPESTDSRDWPYVKEILYTQRQPAVWSEICALAQSMTNILITKIWLQLEQINGLRRQPGKWNIEEVVSLLDKAKMMIDALDEAHPRKLRLLELWAYHSGWVYRPAGLFRQAEKAHCLEMAIAKKRGDKKSALLAEHNVVLAQLENTVLTQQCKPELKILLNQFAKVNKKYRRLLKPDNIDDQRWYANILCHESWYNWLISGQKISQLTIKLILQLATQAQAPNDIHKIFLAINAYENKEYQSAIVFINDINPAMAAYWRSYALLIKLLALKKLGNKNEADWIRKQITDIPKYEHGGYLAVALLKNK